MRVTSNELIRDRIPEIMDGEGLRYVVVAMDDEAFRAALWTKLREEVDEVASAGSADDLAKEIADLYEVIDVVLDVHGLDADAARAADAAAGGAGRVRAAAGVAVGRGVRRRRRTRLHPVPAPMRRGPGRRRGVGHRAGGATRPWFVVLAGTSLAVLAVLAVGGGVSHAQGPLPSVLAPLPAHYLEERLVQLTNEERTRAGVTTLQPSATLAQAARHHAEEMVRLGYLSHVSPTAGRAEVADRVALAGGATVSVGENLAAVALGGIDLPDRVIAGWMQSPGHRQNLLASRWTHVGVGAHEGREGRLYVVQVFAFDPLPLVFAHATWAGTSSVAVRFEVSSTAAGWVGVGRVGAPMATEAIAAGASATLVLDDVDAVERTHVGLGWAADRGAGMIGQESGWFDPANGIWATDHRSDGAVARVSSYVSSPATRDVDLHLAFERPPRDVVVFVDGRPVDGVVTGTSLHVSMPGREGGLRVQVGPAEDGGRVVVTHALTVVVRGERIEVVGGWR